MKFLRIKKSQTRATIQIDLTHILKHPILGIDENLDKFKYSFKEAIKSHTSKLALHCYPHVEHSIDDLSLSVQFKNESVLKDYICMLQSINNNSDRIYQKLIDSPHIIKGQNINIHAFKENIFFSMRDEIVDYKKKQKLSFINAEQTTFNLKITPNFQEITFINFFVSGKIKICFMDCVVQQLNNYSEIYHPNENLTISVNKEKDPYILITSNNKDAISYLSNLFKKLDNESNKIYDIATTNLHISYSQKEQALTEDFTNFLNGFFVKEIMDNHLPNKNNNSNKKLKI
jgi:hypothetical protein